MVVVVEVVVVVVAAVVLVPAAAVVVSADRRAQSEATSSFPVEKRFPCDPSHTRAQSSRFLPTTPLTTKTHRRPAAAAASRPRWYCSLSRDRAAGGRASSSRGRLRQSSARQRWK